MNSKLNGYVVYCNNSDKDLPFGVVSDNYECKAISTSFPSTFKNFLIQIEDRRFYSHRGIDLKAITRAVFANLKSGRIVQGGSSITQQFARNILKDNRKTFVRKIKETVKAIEIEFRYSKDEILNLYFNNVYFGKNLRGIRTAAICYFGKDIYKLNQKELLLLLTILRGPNYYMSHPDKIISRYQLLNKTLFDRRVISRSRYAKNKKIKLEFKNTFLQVINAKTIPFIISKTNDETRSIVSTIDSNVQRMGEWPI